MAEPRFLEYGVRPNYKGQCSAVPNRTEPNKVRQKKPTLFGHKGRKLFSAAKLCTAVLQYELVFSRSLILHRITSIVSSRCMLPQQCSLTYTSRQKNASPPCPLRPVTAANIFTRGNASRSRDTGHWTWGKLETRDDHTQKQTTPR